MGGEDARLLIGDRRAVARPGLSFFFFYFFSFFFVFLRCATVAAAAATAAAAVTGGGWPGLGQGVGRIILETSGGKLCQNSGVGPS